MILHKQSVAQVLGTSVAMARLAVTLALQRLATLRKYIVTTLTPNILGGTVSYQFAKYCNSERRDRAKRRVMGEHH
ncbi:MAG TPA: hypothetical protein V6C85_05545 [Allocoleopsis sp.]